MLDGQNEEESNLEIGLAESQTDNFDGAVDLEAESGSRRPSVISSKSNNRRTRQNRKFRENFKDQIMNAINENKNDFAQEGGNDDKKGAEMRQKA